MVNEKKEAICPKCSYKWGTKSLLRSVTCPSCMYRFKFFPVEIITADQYNPEQKLNEEGSG